MCYSVWYCIVSQCMWRCCLVLCGGAVNCTHMYIYIYMVLGCVVVGWVGLCCVVMCGCYLYDMVLVAVV